MYCLKCRRVTETENITTVTSKYDRLMRRGQTMLGELSEIVNPTLRERIDKSIVGKLIRAKVNFGLGAPIKAKKKLKFTDDLADELYKPVTRNFREGELMLMVLMKFGLLI